MRKLLLFFQNYQSQISTSVLLLFSLAIVVYLNPREARFKYEFEKGKPWSQEDLVAPFDYPVLKSTEEIALEKQELRDNKTLFLVRNSEIEASKRQSLALALKKSYPENDTLNERGVTGAQVQAFADSLLGEIYAVGILEPFEHPLSEQFGEVLLKEAKLSEAVSLTRFYRIRAAASEIEKQCRQAFPGLGADLAKLIKTYLAYNISFDEGTTQKYLDNQITGVLATRGMVQKGELVIAKGNLIDEARFWRLQSLKQSYEGSLSGDNSYFTLLFGQILFVGILFLVLWVFLRVYEPLVLEDVSRLTFILVNLLLMVVIARVVLNLDAEFIYLVPFVILPMILRSFFDTRLALFMHLVALVIIGLQVSNSYEFVFLQFVAAVFSVLLVNNLYKRKDLFLTAGKITLVYALAYLSYALMQEGSFKTVDYQVFGYFLANGLLTLVSFPLIYFEERIFGFVSEISLLELSDTNNPLLREMAEKAPGTFQHSMQVANLTESAVLAIGGNGLLARTGALYHDIGKMNAPMYFIENQTTGINPHDELSFEESAEIIIGHVSAGVEMAKKNRLPDLLIDFIRTHHGTSKVMYFYKQYIKDFPEDADALSKFTYKGPNPFSKETAVLMMADTVEAASRSLKEPDHDAIDQLVERLIDAQMRDGQFENAPITFKEVREVKKIFKKMLMNIYHVRIKYPD